MKKIILILLLLCLCGCNETGKEAVNVNQRYSSVIEAVFDRDTYKETSNYFDINCEMASIKGGYRFYVIIDNPTLAMYDIEAIAVEKGVDYSKVMAASIGILEDNNYALVPNQNNPDQGFYEGISMSGTTKNKATTLYVYVQFKNQDRSNTYSEYFKFNVEFEG